MAKRAASPKKKASAKKRATKKRVANPTTTKKTAPAKTEGAYVASFHVNEQSYESRGETALEAVKTLGASLPAMMFKTKAFLKLAHSGKEASFMIFPIQFRRIQGGKTAQEIWAKKLEARMR